MFCQSGASSEEEGGLSGFDSFQEEEGFKETNCVFDPFSLSNTLSASCQLFPDDVSSYDRNTDAMVRLNYLTLIIDDLLHPP